MPEKEHLREMPKPKEDHRLMKETHDQETHNRGDHHEARPRMRLGVRKVFQFALGIVIVLMVAIVVMGIGIYRFQWNNRWTDVAISVLPYPIVMIDQTLIPIKTYKQDFETLKYYYAKQASSPETLATRIPKDSVLKELAVNRLLQETIRHRLLKRYNVRVDEEKIDEYFQKNILDPADNPDQVGYYIKALYNWDIETYQQKSVRPVLEEQALVEALKKDAPLKTEARTQIEQIQSRLREGQNFEDLAKEFSEDDSATNGGDLGFFGRGEMVKPFEDAAFALKEGEVSDIVETMYGFHIIKLIDRAKKDTNEDGTEEETIQAKHILIKVPDLESTIKKELQNLSVRLLGPDFSWDATALKFVSREQETKEPQPPVELDVNAGNP